MIVVAALLVVVLCACAAHGKPCNESSDIVGFYTACRTLRNQRDALFRYNGATCNASEPGALPLPLNRLNLACNTACDGGFYLPVGASACEACAAGTATLGGGLLVADWSAWPAPSLAADVRFSTRCEDNDNEPYAPGAVKACLVCCSSLSLSLWRYFLLSFFLSYLYCFSFFFEYVNSKKGNFFFFPFLFLVLNP
jgi:hypothetical protein